VKIAAVSLALLAPFAVCAQTVKLVNPGFEQPPKGGEILPGWCAHQHAGDPSYEFAVDNQVFAKGKNAFRITRLQPQDYGALDQTLPGRDLIGKEIEFSALIQAKDVDKRGFVLCINVIDASGDIRNQFRSQPRTTGTVDKWTPLSVRAKVPSGTQRVEVGFLLIGGGTIWADEATLKIIPAEKAQGAGKAVEKAKGAKPTKAGTAKEAARKDGAK